MYGQRDEKSQWLQSAGQIAESILTDPLAVRAEVTVHKWIQLSTSVTDISATATRTR